MARRQKKQEPENDLCSTLLACNADKRAEAVAVRALFSPTDGRVLEHVAHHQSVRRLDGPRTYLYGISPETIPFV